MNLQYSNERNLAADCPKCRKGTVILVTVSSGTKSEDFLGCKRCKFSMSVNEYKDMLFSR